MRELEEFKKRSADLVHHVCWWILLRPEEEYGIEEDSWVSSLRIRFQQQHLRNKINSNKNKLLQLYCKMKGTEMR